MTTPEPTTTLPSHNIFLSWSGERSRLLARSLADWLPLVIQSARPWMSDSIQSGQRWREKLGQQLQSISIGVVCLFPENQDSTAIHFEAGALSSQVRAENRLIPYCFGLRPSDVKWPLGDFQVVEADREGTLRLLKSINSVMTPPLPQARLEACFESLWNRLETEIAALPPEPAGIPKPRSTDEMMAEVLDRVRSIEREVARQQEPSLVDRIRQRHTVLEFQKNLLAEAERATASHEALAAAIAGASKGPTITEILSERHLREELEKAEGSPVAKGLAATLGASIASGIGDLPPQ